MGCLPLYIISQCTQIQVSVLTESHSTQKLPISQCHVGLLFELVKEKRVGFNIISDYHFLMWHMSQLELFCS